MYTKKYKQKNQPQICKPNKLRRLIVYMYACTHVYVCVTGMNIVLHLDYKKIFSVAID